MLLDEQSDEFFKEFDTLISKYKEAILKNRESFVAEQEQMNERMTLLENDYKHYQSREASLRQETSKLSTLGRTLETQIADTTKESHQLEIAETELNDKIEKIGRELSLRKNALNMRREQRRMQAKQSGPEIQLFEKRLGLFLKPTARQSILDISFCYIDPANPHQKFGFLIEILPKESEVGQLYRLDSAYPSIYNGNLQGLLVELNDGDISFYVFLQKARKVFLSEF